MALSPIGVTVVTPAYRHLEAKAIRAFKQHSGLEVQVLRTNDKAGFENKIKLDRLCGRRPIVFFDVDTRVLRALDLSRWRGDWLAVHDPAVFIPHTFPHDDCESHKMDKASYWNSGFFACDLRRAEHREVFRRARRHRDYVEYGRLEKPVDWTDQFYLNLAAQEIGLPVTLLPFAFNMYVHAVKHGGREAFPRHVVVAHAAGFPLAEKATALDAMEVIFGGEVTAMQPQALLQNHVLNQELR